MIKIVPVVLCGGSGTRLWPLSRTGFPKQFLILSGNSSLFQQAIQRIHAIETNDFQIEKTLVVTNEEHRFLALDQLRELKSLQATLILEPVARNTAPALTLAALRATDLGEDPVLVVSPSDQIITDSKAFTSALQDAVRAAADGTIVVLGITPSGPETGYGYIRHNKDRKEFGEFSVVQFTEKPDLNTAQQFVNSGEYCWNSGIFVLRASTWLRAIRQFRPDIAELTTTSWKNFRFDDQFIRPAKSSYADIPNESIDYAVMEKCPASNISISMIPLAAGWNDLGAWDSLWQVSEKDTRGNVIQGDAFQTDSTNNLIFSSGRLVSAVGVNDLIIVETADAVLVADRNQSQKVKKIVSMLESNNRTEQTLHRKAHRPWGWYDSVDEDERFKVKRINVKPGASLSLQKHHHRAEHWIVVKGTAEVTCGEKIILLTENQSTYIPLGEVHRLRNPGVTPLEIIEVQSGSYLGEDDIVRFEDTYGRN